MAALLEEEQSGVGVAGIEMCFGVPFNGGQIAAANFPLPNAVFRLGEEGSKRRFAGEPGEDFLTEGKRLFKLLTVEKRARLGGGAFEDAAPLEGGARGEEGFPGAAELGVIGKRLKSLIEEFQGGGELLSFREFAGLPEGGGNGFFLAAPASLFVGASR